MKVDRVELLESIENLNLVFSGLAKNATDIAHAKRVLFDAYVSEGFTENQALELIKTFTL